ncbi:MAG: ABC transporter ATP-binding protein [Pseudomonadota bacterium]
MEALLQIKDLKVCFPHQLTALNNVHLTIEKAMRVGVVGESGAGKSMLAYSILDLISEPGWIESGQIWFDGCDLTTLNFEQMRKIRGNRIAMIFQDPMVTLNPVLSIGDQMVELLINHQNITFEQAKEKAIETLRQVLIPLPERRFDSYPHELSGGLRQRVVIAIALLCEPELIIADEPTTALDVTIQAEIMSLLLKLCQQRQMSLMLITHDLAVVAEVTTHIVVMYGGHIVEQGLTSELIKNPSHPYTKGLIEALPKRADHTTKRLNQIPGMMPSLDQIPRGCVFHPRCYLVKERCQRERPQLMPLEKKRYSTRNVACFFPIGG